MPMKAFKKKDTSRRAANDTQPTLELRGLPGDWPELIREAERRGYLEFHGSRIQYKCATSREENFNDPEEKVRAGLCAWLVLEKEYPAGAIRVEVPIPRRTPSDYADIVVYTDSACRTPYLVVEAKEPGVSRGEFKQAIEQAFGNANSLRDTALALTDSVGARNDLPKAYGNISQFRLVASDIDHDIRTFLSGEVENMVRKAHAAIWAGGKRDPLAAFDASQAGSHRFQWLGRELCLRPSILIRGSTSSLKLSPPTSPPFDPIAPARLDPQDSSTTWLELLASP